jgi:hypothetical protein
MIAVFGTTNAMRTLKTIYFAVLFALAMGLFCGELPESLRLHDDTTNDYVANSSSSAARESEAAKKQAPAKETLSAAACQIERNRARPTAPAPAPVSGKELLPLLSIRRT